MVAVMVYKLEIFEGAVEEWGSKQVSPSHPPSIQKGKSVYVPTQSTRHLHQVEAS